MKEKIEAIKKLIAELEINEGSELRAVVFCVGLKNDKEDSFDITLSLEGDGDILEDIVIKLSNQFQ